MKRLLHVPFLFPLLLAALLAPTALAQPTYDLRFQTQVSGGDFLVTVQVKSSTGTDDLGTANLVFNYNDLAMTPKSGTMSGPLTDGTDFTFVNFDNDHGGNANYGNATVVATQLAGQDRLSLNIELNIDNGGTVVTTGFMDVATLTFAINDAAAMANLVWEGGNTVIFDGDNTTEWTQGLVEGDNSVLPVELVAFEGRLTGHAVVLQWQTASETSNAGFEVQGLSQPETGLWDVLGFVEGSGTTAKPQQYSYRTGALGAGRHRFRLRQVDFDGVSTFSPEVEVIVGVVGDYQLSEAYPNPFNPQTRFTLAVAREQQVRVEVFNLLGQRVALLHEGWLPANKTYTFTFEANGLSSGIYLIRATGEAFTTVRQATMLK